MSHDPLSRTSVRLVATDAYEVWLLGWTNGQRVELHDHGGANAAFVVLEGVLDEITLGFAGSTTQRLGVGSVRRSGGTGARSASVPPPAPPSAHTVGPTDGDRREVGRREGPAT